MKRPRPRTRGGAANCPLNKQRTWRRYSPAWEISGGAENATNRTICRSRGTANFFDYNPPGMIRIREIVDPDLKRMIVDALASRRGCSIASIPEWFELDDLDFVDLLNDLKSEDDEEWPADPRM